MYYLRCCIVQGSANNLSREPNNSMISLGGPQLLRGGAGREKAYILNGHIFVNTYQNCTKFSVVVYCVDI